MEQYFEKSGDLFSVIDYHILVQACNTKGVWGRGIAKVFAYKYPSAYQNYAIRCAEISDEELQGTCFITAGGGRLIGCLFTSKGYGQMTDPAELILKSTKTAIKDLFLQLTATFPNETINVASPRINAGLFSVPWKKTEKIIKEALLSYPKIIWTTYLGETR